jgi:hypothetical protein
VREHLAEAHLDVVGSLIETFVEGLMGAEVDAICGAAYHQPRAHQSAHTAIAAVLCETRLGTTRAQRSQSFVRGATSPTGSKSAVVVRKASPDKCDRHLLACSGS